jgi:aspartyl-tRNA(Asn)/glutamyl-tRNA(Gln) amidotransferase subunit A
MIEPGTDVAGMVLAVRNGESAAALAEQALTAAAAAPGTFWNLDEARALDDARRIDARVARGEPVGPLAGVPVGVKDTFAVRGLPRTLGLRERVDVPDEDAELVRRLRAADAVVVGTTAMDQLAWSMTGQSPHRPACPNPGVPGALPGGSSGGSAAAVAAGIVPIALGTDTAGSARVPAAWCGTVGSKLSHDALPLTGCAPLAPSLDSLGILGRSVGDCRLVTRVLGGGGPWAPERRAGRRRLGVARETLDAGIEAFALTLDALRDAGHDVVVLDAELAAPGLGRVLAAEFAATWAAALEGVDVNAEVGEGLRHGAAVSAAGYLHAREAIARAERRARAVFDVVDGLLLPTTAATAPPIDAPPTVAEASRFTRGISAFGWPAISIPLGEQDGRPLGLQVAGAPGADAIVLDLADELCDRPALSHRQPPRSLTKHER